MNILKFHKFISKIKSYSLSKQEKADLRADFLNKIGVDVHPVSIFNTIYFVQTIRYAKLVAFSFLVVAVGITPFALAAEGSMPGDILYPIKVTVNEPIKKSVKAIIPFKVSSDDIRRQQSNDEYNNKQIGTDINNEDCEDNLNNSNENDPLINISCEKIKIKKSTKNDKDEEDNRSINDTQVIIKADNDSFVQDIEIETDIELEASTTLPIKTSIPKISTDSTNVITPPPTTSPYSSI